MTALAIEIARPDDRDRVSALIAESYSRLLAGHYEPALLARALPFMTRANPRLLASGTYYLALDRDRRLLGCGGWSPERPGSGEVVSGLGHIRHFAVHSDAKRTGAGRALLERCITAAEASGITVLESYSTLPAEPFYASFGFARVALIEVPMGPDLRFPSVHMCRHSPA